MVTRLKTGGDGRKSFENYLLAINYMVQPTGNGGWPAANGPVWTRQIAILSHFIREDAVETFDQFECDAGAGEDYDRLTDVVAKFYEYFNQTPCFNPRRINILFEWCVFWLLTRA